MAATELNEARIDFDGMIVTSDCIGAGSQPWGGASCYVYRVRVCAKEGDFTTSAFGSQMDFSNGANDKAEEMAWTVLYELLDAVSDPEEMWQMVTAETDGLTLERVRGILGMIDFALLIQDRLEANAGEIREAYEGL